MLSKHKPSSLLRKFVNYGLKFYNIRPRIDSTGVEHLTHDPNVEAGNTKGGSITVPMTSSLTGLESAV
jgi:hypothetical protein